VLAGQPGKVAPSVSPLAAQPVEFAGSFPDPLVALTPSRPEIAMIGRSNCGKSSLINALLGRPGLARISGTPGKTALLNAYRLPDFYLVDLPGYGFSRAGKAARARYRQLITRYLRERLTVAGIVWLLDIRHDPSKDDLEIREILVESGRPVLVALTKADKLTRTAGAARTTRLAAALGLREDQVLVTSSRSLAGVPGLAASIIAEFGGAP